MPEGTATEFGYNDNPAFGGYTEPNWNVGAWGDDISSQDLLGVALPDTPHNTPVRVTNEETGRSVMARVVDKGPSAPGASIDLTYGTARAIGSPYNSTSRVSYEIMGGAQSLGNENLLTGGYSAKDVPGATAPESLLQEEAYAPDEPPPADEPEKPEPQEEPAPAQMDSRAPLDIFNSKFPQFTQRTDEEKIAALRQKLAPQMPADRFGTLARSQNGLQGIKNWIYHDETPIQKIVTRFPGLADKNPDDLARDIYQRLVVKKKIDPNVMDEGDFAQFFNPPPAWKNAAAGAVKGMARAASEVTHAGAADTPLFGYGSIDNISNWAYSVLDHVTGPVQAGTQAKSLTKQAEDWMGQNAFGQALGEKGMPADYLLKFLNWMRGAAANQRALAVQDDKRRQLAQQAAPIAGTAGALVGGTAAGLLEQLPIMSMIGGASQTAALLATFAEGGSRYSAAIQAGHDSAWLEGLEGAATAPMFRYMLNSPAGRLKSGFMNWAMQAGEPEFEKFLRGEKTDFTELVWNSSVAFLLGQGLGHEME